MFPHDVWPMADTRPSFILDQVNKMIATSHLRIKGNTSLARIYFYFMLVLAQDARKDGYLFACIQITSNYLESTFILGPELGAMDIKNR